MPSITGSELMDLRRDRARLNWLEAHLPTAIAEALWEAGYRIPISGALRKKIDAAMEHERPE